ncbi:hypothetical protein KM043_011051 [Ampulex compressa]|nr:hypothetical protein KM043_011051 [Ampulex compressa]
MIKVADLPIQPCASLSGFCTSHLAVRSQTAIYLCRATISPDRDRGRVNRRLESSDPRRVGPPTKMKLLTCSLILDLCWLILAQRTFLDSPENIEAYRVIRNWILKNFGKTGQEGGRWFNEAKNLRKIQTPLPDDVPFPCNVTEGRSQEVPTSVHRVRPGDIDVVAAMGDSLTAGAGIFGSILPQVIIENRGASAFGGGQGNWRSILTLPNIIKVFNPNLTGYAVDDSYSFDESSRFNVGENFAMSRDMPYMANILVKRIKSNPKVNVQKDWKLISLMIGANDFCSEICFAPTPESILEDHKSDLIKTFRILRDNLPRTFVSLVPPPNLEKLVSVRESRPRLVCDLIIPIACTCMFSLKYRNLRQRYYKVMDRWEDVEHEVANYPEFQREDFAVVVQPINRYIQIPTAADGLPDLSFFSADCFHLSQKSNARIANTIWNSLLQPLGQKKQSWDAEYKHFLCPTQERPYLFTQKNSPS